MDLRNLNWIFFSWYQLFNTHIMNLWKLDWVFESLWIWKTDWGNLNWVFFNLLWYNMDNFDDLFSDDGLFNDDWDNLFNNVGRVFNDESRVFHDDGLTHDFNDWLFEDDLLLDDWLRGLIDHSWLDNDRGDFFYYYWSDNFFDERNWLNFFDNDGSRDFLDNHWSSSFLKDHRSWREFP